MRLKRWMWMGVLWLGLSGCASHRVSCGGWLQPINTPAVGAERSESAPADLSQDALEAGNE